MEASLKLFYEMWGEDVADLLVELGDFPTEGYMDWWHKDEWVGLLFDEMFDGASDAAVLSAWDIMELMGADPDELDVDALLEQIRKPCWESADRIVQSTFERLAGKLDNLGSTNEDDVRSCVTQVMAESYDDFGWRNASHFARASANQATVFGAKQVDPKCQKEWHTNSVHPRASHLSVSGQRIPIDDLFRLDGGSAMWPHDTDLPASESANCSCTIDIISKGKNVSRPRRIQDVARELNLAQYDPEKLDDAIRRCQGRVGCDGKPWNELTAQEKAATLAELRSRDQEWVATGICRSTRLAANPRAEQIRLLHPRAYAEWQDSVSRILSYETKKRQYKHIKGTDLFNEADRLPSWFIWDRTMSEDEQFAAIRDVINRCAGQGYPEVKNGVWLKTEKVPHAGTRAMDGDRYAAGKELEVDGIKIHYANGKDSGVHAAPMWSGE